MSLEMLAEKLLTASAVKTLSTELRVVCNDSVSDAESLDLGTQAGDFSDSLMTCIRRSTM